MEFFERQITTKTVFNGKVINVRCDEAELITGKIVSREVVEHTGGVAIVPVTADGNVLLVRQYRYAMGEELLEIPAGKLEKGENHYDCAIRELSEETGCTASNMTYLGSFYPSPGFCSEILHIYLAEGLSLGESHPDEDELLSVVSMPVDEVRNKIMTDEIRDGKTIVGILKALRHIAN